jgi:hypothetical protein
MHRDPVIHRGGRDIVARELDMLGIALDGIDRRIRRTSSTIRRALAAAASAASSGPLS